MEKKYILIGFLLICVITGSYFVFSQNSTAVSDVSSINTIVENQSVQNSTGQSDNLTVDKNIDINPIKPANNNLNYVEMDNSDDTTQPVKKLGYENSNVEYKSYLYPKVNDYNRSKIEKKLIYPDLTDRYWQCVECGKFIPLGNITKQLPAELLFDEKTCPDDHTTSNSSAFMYSDYVSFSYEDIYDMWLHSAHYDSEIIEDSDSDFNIEEQNALPDNSANNPPEEATPEVTNPIITVHTSPYLIN